MTYLYYYLVGINLIAFVAYGLDKRKAVRHARRISESTLLLYALLGGGLGSLVGMGFFRHKTKKWKFLVVVPLLTLLWAVGIYYLQYRS